VLDTATGATLATIAVGDTPTGLDTTPDGSRLLVANQRSHTVTAIDTATFGVLATIPVGNTPIAFGDFIEPRSIRGPRLRP
jgi:YVTN family beta-propeller protein